MVKILIVEDEPAMQLGLRDNLEYEGYQVEVCGDGKEGLEVILSDTYDLVLLDVMLPSMSGFDVCKAARAAGNDTPVILLTARGEEIDKVLGLELGADDYITKPFSVRELLARIKANLRRSNRQSVNTSSQPVTIGKASVDFNAYRAVNSTTQQDISFSHKEYELLRYLYERQHAVVSRHDLLEQIWGYEQQPTTRTVDNFIARIRQKIEPDPHHPTVIITAHGTGYKLIV